MKEPDKTLPLAEILPTLSNEAAAVVKGAVEGAIGMFAEEHEVLPAILATDNKGKPHVYPAEHRNQKEKEVVWALLRYLRKVHPVTLLVSEVWLSRYDNPKKLKQYVPPSQDPNRSEAVMLHLADHKRHLLIAADITRHPDHLGEFTVRHDSQNPDLEYGERMGGALYDDPQEEGEGHE